MTFGGLHRERRSARRRKLILQPQHCSEGVKIIASSQGRYLQRAASARVGGMPAGRCGIFDMRVGPESECSIR